MRQMRAYCAFLTISAVICGAAFAQAPKNAPTDADEPAVTVPGRVERPIPPPLPDSRSWLQRYTDRSAFDRCVMKAVNDEQESGGYPVKATPEEACALRTGMRDRNAIPAWRAERRR